jgi:hypothetical protein
VPKGWDTFVEDAFRELSEARELLKGVFLGINHKGKWNGQGSAKLENDDAYKGGFKDGNRHGSGLCLFKSGAIYRGEWRDDKPHGQGTLYSGNNEILECKFEKGFVISSGESNSTPNSTAKIKIMFNDSSFYMGKYSEHQKHG